MLFDVQVFKNDECAFPEGGEYYGISQVPCKDRCQELRQREEQTLRMKQQGAQLKQAYLVAAKALQNADNVGQCLSASILQSPVCYYVRVSCLLCGTCHGP